MQVVILKKMKIFVDTCVWRYWLTLKNNVNFENHDFEIHAKVFDQIYNIVSSDPQKNVFLYNARIEGELPDEYRSKLPVSFSRISENRYMNQVPIPLSRADGTYKADGSVLLGGSFGGTLREILSMNGYDHETALQNTKPNYRLANPVHTKPRKKEFDVEHVESALEANADLFITTDQPFINRLRRAHQLYPENSIIEMANNICVTPSHALNRVEAMFSQ